MNSGRPHPLKFNLPERRHPRPKTLLPLWKACQRDKEVLSVFLNSSQQCPLCSVYCVGRSMLPNPESFDSLPESRQGCPKVFFHGLFLKLMSGTVTWEAFMDFSWTDPSQSPLLPQKKLTGSNCSTEQRCLAKSKQLDEMESLVIEIL